MLGREIAELRFVMMAIEGGILKIKELRFAMGEMRRIFAKTGADKEPEFRYSLGNDGK
ncbi:hypothetical protein B2K_40310 [Paenibacillus mucilaginosus K02]|uniref:Uncharacterized protein n=1 Tax=Paenibacillus mucilaginosus K02 TaxID=997761 RepID=R9UNH4_9BACL|nr:hypothetical protein B2K_40310 [Paenibacillus mucilaginosus K02]